MKETRTDEQVLKECIARANWNVNHTNNADTRMILDALIEKQIKDENVKSCGECEFFERWVKDEIL